MLEPWHIWVIAGLLLWIIEIFTPGFVAGVFGTACLITAFFAWLGLSYLIQLLVFAIVTGAMTLGIRPIVLKHINKNKEKAKTNVDALIGQTVMVTEAIDSSKGMGYVKVGGETWRAVTSDDTYVGEGERVRIKDIEGCKVIVEIIPKK